MRAPALLFALLGATLTVACGGKDSPAAPDVLDIGGTWSYQTSNVTVDGISCSITGRTMTVSQTGTTFTGHLSGGVASCESDSGSYSEDLAADGITDDIVNGVVDGTSISFDLDFDPGASLVGTVSGNAISGTITERTYNESGSVVSGS